MINTENESLSFGDYLKSVREEKQIRLEEISEQTRIRSQILSYLENEERDKLPEEVYVKGFIRAYAKVVGADGDKAVELYLSSLHGTSKASTEPETSLVQNSEFAERKIESRNPPKSEPEDKEAPKSEPENKKTPKSENKDKRKKKTESENRGKKKSESKGKKKYGKKDKKKSEKSSKPENTKETPSLFYRLRENRAFWLILSGIILVLLILFVSVLFVSQHYDDTADKQFQTSVNNENHDTPASEPLVIPDSKENISSEAGTENSSLSSEKTDNRPATHETPVQPVKETVSDKDSIHIQDEPMEPALLTPSSDREEQKPVVPDDIIVENQNLQDMTNSDQGTGSQEESSEKPLEKLVLKIKAVEKTWMQVVIDADISKVYMLNPGEHRELEAHSGFQLTIGNPKGVRLTLNDAPVSGDSGERGSGGVLKMKIP